MQLSSKKIIIAHFHVVHSMNYSINAAALKITDFVVTIL